VKTQPLCASRIGVGVGRCQLGVSIIFAEEMWL
jgi:hypothetical protein